MLFEHLVINYIHPGLGIGLQNIRNAWLLENEPVKLTTTLHRAALFIGFLVPVKESAIVLLKKG